VFFRKAEILLRTAPERHQLAWEAAHSAGLVGAGASWFGLSGMGDAAIRAAFIDPPYPAGPTVPHITQIVSAYSRQFALDRGSEPVGIVYSALRAARRAIAENPGDAFAYFLLGRSYLELLSYTSEASWVSRNPQLLRVRQVQASAALNRAIALNPRLAQAHLQLGRLYLTLDCLDLALVHLTTYRDSPPRWGGPRSTEINELNSELEKLSKRLDYARREFARESERSSVIDRALKAHYRKLGGEARDILLKSDVAAFGTAGMELELDLLLRTGRPEDVIEWTIDVGDTLSDYSLHWLRSLACAATGAYDDADKELGELVGPGGQLPPAIRITSEVGPLLGKAVLNEYSGAATFSDAIRLVLNRSDYQGRLNDIRQRLAGSAEMTVLRGLVSLEAGAMGRARDAFRDALAFSPERWGSGQLEFASRQVAWDCLTLLGIS